MADQKFTIRIGGDSKEFTRAVGKVKRQLGDFKRAVFSIQGALAGLGAAFTARAIIQATARQEQAFRQLEARIQSTGAAAGLSARELTTFAGELQKVTTFGDEAIMEMEALLLTFTQIKGPVFKDATRAVLDMSTAMGTSLSSSALQLGKALNDPVKGLTALSRAGVQFTKQQQAQITALAESGRMAEAQGLILVELQTQFGGAAEAAADTFGGSLAQLQNTMGDLIEAKGSSLNGARDAVKELTALMSAPATVEAFNTVIAGVVKLTNAVAKAIVKVADFTRAVGEILGGASGFGAEYDALEKRLEERQERLLDLERGLSGGRNKRSTEAKDLLRAERDQLVVEIAQIKREMDAVFDGRTQKTGGKAPEEIVPDLLGIPTGRTTGGAGGGAGKATGPTGFGAALEAAAEKQRAAAERMRDSMRQASEAIKDSLDPTRELNRELERNRELYEAGYLSAEEYAHAQQQVQARIGEVRGGLEQTKEALVETGRQLNQFAVQGARNIQSALADFLFSPAEQGFKGLADNFTRVIQRMASEAAAAQIAKKLFGDYGSGGGFGGIVGGILEKGGALLSQIPIFHQGGIVGGPAPWRALPAFDLAAAPRYHNGGLAGDEIAAVLRRGEEVLPRSDPRHRANGGGVNVVNNFTVQGETSRATQEQIAARVGDAVSRAMRRNR